MLKANSPNSCQTTTQTSKGVSSPTRLTLIGPLTLSSASVTISPFCRTSHPPSSLRTYTSLRTSGIASRHVSNPRSLSSWGERARATSDGQKVLGGCLVSRKCLRWVCKGEAEASEDIIVTEDETCGKMYLGWAGHYTYPFLGIASVDGLPRSSVTLTDDVALRWVSY